MHKDDGQKPGEWAKHLRAAKSGNQRNRLVRRKVKSDIKKGKYRGDAT